MGFKLVEKKYYEIKNLENYYLEDSYLLEFSIFGDQVRFMIEAVLTENHSLYSEPKVNEQYCYKDIDIIFKNIKKVELEKCTISPGHSADPDCDLGNVEYFSRRDGYYFIQFGWGAMKIFTSLLPTVNIRS